MKRVRIYLDKNFNIALLLICKRLLFVFRILKSISRNGRLMNIITRVLHGRSYYIFHSI